MSKFEKRINIFMRILGIGFVIQSIFIFLGYLKIETWAVGALYVLIGMFLLTMKFSKPSNKVGNNKS